MRFDEINFESIMPPMEIIGTVEAAQRLGITVRRVQQLIEKGDLPATKVGRDFAIIASHLKKVQIRPKPGPKPGKPRKKKESG
jgi:excisionase family DNA binding protein